MKKRLVAASTDPNGLLPFGPQVTNSVNDLNSQLPNCSLAQKPTWVADSRQTLTAPVVQLGGSMPTTSKSEYTSTTSDENRNSLGLASSITCQSQYASPKKPDAPSQASFSTNQLIEAFIHTSQLAAKGGSPQQSDLAQLILEMAKNQQLQSQQTMNRAIPHRNTPDKLLITSRSPPLRSNSESVRGFVDNSHSKSRNSFAHSTALQSPPPPPPSLSTSAPRSQPSRPLTASDYNSAATAFYNHQLRLTTPSDQQGKNNLDKLRQTASLSIDQQFYSAALFCMMAQQQQQMRGHAPPQMSFPHPDSEKKSLIGFSKVGWVKALYVLTV